jgi:hypothetical protein
MPIDEDRDLDEDAPVSPRSEPFWSRHRGSLLLVGALGIPAIAVGLWWFQPQSLLFDNVVDEAFPVDAAVELADEAGSGDDPSGDDPGGDGPSGDGERARVDDERQEGAGDTAEEVEPAPSGPAELATGSFVSRNRYTVTGTAATYELEDGQRVLRLEDFESTNGPDLFVYLTAAGAEDDDAALDADFVDLGALTGNIGSQNYVIPADVDLDRYDSVVIWCRRFTTSFGVADLAT